MHEFVRRTAGKKRRQGPLRTTQEMGEEEEENVQRRLVTGQRGSGQNPRVPNRLVIKGLVTLYMQKCDMSKLGDKLGHEIDKRQITQKMSQTQKGFEMQTGVQKSGRT